MNKAEENKPISYAECFKQIGTTHLNRNMDSDDVIYTSEKPQLLFYGLADGQSGKRYCRQGAETVLEAIGEYIQDRKIHDLSQYRHIDEIQYEIIRIVREKLGNLSLENQVKTTEFASTILAMGIDPATGQYMTIHLGDGGILGKRSDGSLNLISAPENGITSKYTWLTTSEGALLHLRIGFGQISNYNQVVMFTDGAEAICRGTNIGVGIRRILNESREASQLAEMICNSRPSDDATFISIDCKKMSENSKDKWLA